MTARPQLRCSLQTDAIRPPCTSWLGVGYRSTAEADLCHRRVQIRRFKRQANECGFPTTRDDFDEGFADAVEGHLRTLGPSWVKTPARR